MEMDKTTLIIRKFDEALAHKCSNHQARIIYSDIAEKYTNKDAHFDLGKKLDEINESL